MADTGRSGMYSDEWRIALRAEAAARNCASTADCLNFLRRLPLADFAELMLSMPREELPGLSRLLPRMAPVEAQRKWTGFEGAVLPRQTVTFVRGLACNLRRDVQEPAGRCAGSRFRVRIRPTLARHGVLHRSKKFVRLRSMASIVGQMPRGQSVRPPCGVTVFADRSSVFGNI